MISAIDKERNRGQRARLDGSILHGIRSGGYRLKRFWASELGCILRQIQLTDSCCLRGNVGFCVFLMVDESEHIFYNRVIGFDVVKGKEVVWGLI